MLDYEDDREHEEPKHGGGPKTPEGKAITSKNSVKHGCRSRILILPGEKQEDFDAIEQRWYDCYQPRDAATFELVDQLVLNRWLFERAEKNFLEVSEQLALAIGPMTKWNAAQNHQFQLAQRYKTTAERSLSKARSELETYLKNRRAEEMHHHKISLENHRFFHQLDKLVDKHESKEGQQIQQAAAAGQDVNARQAQFEADKQANRGTLQRLQKNLAQHEAQSPRAQILFQGQTHPKKLRKLNILDQWVDITVDNGVTRTLLSPSNALLIERGQSMDPPPELVYRRLNFPDGIPDEYNWTSEDPTLKQYGGIGIQRMSIDTWLDTIDAEALRSDGHIGPCDDPLPRPKERGSCSCSACERNHLLLLQRSK